jgi:ketosteroid isomerase-like protein
MGGYFKWAFFMLILACFSIIFPLESVAELKEQSEIIRLLQKWPEDFNAKNIQAVCRLFAPDLIASYPGSSDRGYEEMCRQLTKVLTDSDRLFRYDPPKIEQVMIEGDLAVVRLVWTLRISSKDQSAVEIIKENGLDVFIRQGDGSWKIAISYAYPLVD